MTNQGARGLVLDALCRVENDGAYSELVLNSVLNKTKLDSRDKDFASRIFYGVLERKLTLDFIISSYSNRKINQTPDVVLGALRIGIYELLYMKTDQFAAVNEAVSLVKKAGKPKASGFVNAVLRAFIRDDLKIKWPSEQKDKLEFMSVKYSCPKWLVKSLALDYGEKIAEEFLKDQFGKPPFTIRVNSLKTTDDKLKDSLIDEGYEVENGSFNGCLEVKGKNVLKSKYFDEGFFHVQDVSSQLCADVVSSFNPKTILDVCSAPGGKSFTIAENNQEAEITSCDLYESRVKLIKDGANRLGLHNINAIKEDASSKIDDKKYDLVLCDVPCSGFGVIRRKPEIKYKKQESLKGLGAIQSEILDASSFKVKEGAILIYSTCTLRKAENEKIVEKFLKTHKEFKPCVLPDIVRSFYPEAKSFVTCLPGKLNGDGFFMAAFRKDTL